MKKTIPALIAFCLLLITACKDPASLQTGSIQGRVIGPDSTGVFRVTVAVYGTNLISITDSSGNYVFYNVPPGSYTLTVSYGSDTTVQVSAGETTHVPDLFALPEYYNYGSYARTVVSELYLLDVEDSILARLDIENRIFLRPETVSIRLELGRLGVTTAPVEDSIVIFRNGTVLYSGTPPKGRLETEQFALSGADTFGVLSGGVREMFFVLDSSNMSHNTVRILTGATTLTPSATQYLVGPYVTIGALTYRISHPNYEEIDWDIALVSETEHDTCSWRNPEPDWGLKNDNTDDPEFKGDASSDWVNHRYPPDVITAIDLPSGTYSFYVTFFGGTPDSSTATPQLDIELSNCEDCHILDQYYEIRPSAPLHQGDTWFAGRLFLPEKRFEPGE